MSDSIGLAPEPGRARTKLEGSDRPYVTLKAAITLDGKIATRGGASRWITGETARAHAHRLRAGHDGVVVGIRTVLADDPALTARLPGARSPARIVLDSRARIDPAARCLADDGARRIVVVGKDAPEANARRLRDGRVEVIRCGAVRPEPGEFLPRLRALGLNSLLVEGGANVHANLIALGEADELFLYVAGRVFGDRQAPGWCEFLGIDRVEDAPRLTLSPPRLVGEDVLVHGYFR